MQKINNFKEIKQQTQYKTNKILSDTDINKIDDNYEITIRTRPIKLGIL